MSQLVRGPWRVMQNAVEDEPYKYVIEADCSCCGTKVEVVSVYFGKDKAKGEFVRNHFHHIVACVNSGVQRPTVVSSQGLTNMRRQRDSLLIELAEAKKAAEHKQFILDQQPVTSRRCVRGHLSNHDGPACKCGANWKDDQVN